jgi:hypothetical protein
MYVLRHITVPFSAGIAWRIIGREGNKNDAFICKIAKARGLSESPGNTKHIIESLLLSYYILALALSVSFQLLCPTAARYNKAP